jgi:hypothetical protein
MAKRIFFTKDGKINEKGEGVMGKIYKEPLKSETETTVNVLYGENALMIYTNKVDLQKKLCKVIGKPYKEHIRGKSITGSTWKMSLDEKTKISKMILKANIFEI